MCSFSFDFFLRSDFYGSYSYYWESRDEDLLKKTFEKYTNLIDGFTSSIEMIPMNEGENLEEYLIRLASITNKNLK